MPIYEYQCQRCESHFEVRQAVSDAAPSICEKCGGRLEKKWSLSGFQFKGEGWYVTDYAKKKSPTDKSNSSGKSSEDGASADKTEKSSPSESTAKTEPASNQKSEASSVSKAEKTSKKD